MAKRKSGEAQAIAGELRMLRGAEVKQHFAVWDISEGIRFVAILGPGNPPLTGIALPTIMRRVSEHLSRIDIPQPGDAAFGPNPLGSRLWDFSPGVFLPPPWFAETPIPDASLRINDGADVDTAKVTKLVGHILSSESEARTIAGSIGDVIDYGRKGTMAPRSSPFFAAAAYFAIGRAQDAEECIAEVESLFGARQEFADLFARFVENLREEHRRSNG